MPRIVGDLHIEGDIVARSRLRRGGEDLHVQFLRVRRDRYVDESLPEVVTLSHHRDADVDIRRVVGGQWKGIFLPASGKLNHLRFGDDAAFHGQESKRIRGEWIRDEDLRSVAGDIGLFIRCDLEALVRQVGPRGRACSAHPDQGLCASAAARDIEHVRPCIGRDE